MSGKFVLAILLAITTLSLSAHQAVARPAGPTDCRISDVYASFRDALGDDLVGDCESEQVLIGEGLDRQKTTEGMLYWNRYTNRAVFTDGARLWRDGPAGIGTLVTLGGLSDKTTAREPVIASAARVLDLATIDPYELDDGWDYVDLPELRFRTNPASCRDKIPNRTAGNVQVWLVNRAERLQVSHTVAAIPDADIGAWRNDKDRISADCDDWTTMGESGQINMKIHAAPFLELGDDSFLRHYEFTHVETGRQRHSLVGTVRYGGVISVMTATTRGDTQTADDIRPLVEQMAKHANARIQTAAWYIRE